MVGGGPLTPNLGMPAASIKKPRRSVKDETFPLRCKRAHSARFVSRAIPAIGPLPCEAADALKGLAHHVITKLPSQGYQIINAAGDERSEL